MLQRLHGDGAGLLAGAMAAHAVGDQEQRAFAAAIQTGVLVQCEAALVDQHRLAQAGDEELVLVDRPLESRVAEAERIHLAAHGEVSGDRLRRLTPERP